MSDYNEITAVITTEEPAVAATLDDLRYLVLHGKKGDKGDPGKDAEGAVRYDAAQTLSDAQKEQARLNIEAVSENTFSTLEMDVENVKTSAYAHIRDASAHVSAADRARWDASGGAVDSVNGKTGSVILDASDVGALSDDTQIPSKTSDLTNDSGFVNAQQAAASAPVQSVNGQTGAVTIPTGDPNAVLYTEQTLTPAQMEQARENIGAGTYTKPSGGIPDSDIASAATWNAKYTKPASGIPASDLASGVIPTVPQMATDPNMTDWTSGKTVDAAVLKADFQNALVQLGEVQGDVARKANVSDIPTAVSELANDSGYQTASDVQTAISGVRQLPAGGATGDFLRKTASGVAWQTVPSAESNSFGGGS